MNWNVLNKREATMRFLQHVVAPVAFYFLCFILLTYPLILNFSERFFTDDSDGMLHVWNLWWVDQGITRPDLYPSIWHTDMVNWPFGVSLLGHTLVPVNGLMAVFLLRFMPMVATHNIIVIFSFVMTGLTAYWLAYYFSRSSWGSLAAGYIFTFSTYHFAQYKGHLNLIALEWIPLFALFFYILLYKPNVWISMAAALSLWLVFFSDYYYLLYCIFLAGVFVVTRMIGARNVIFFLKTEYAAPLVIFALLGLLLIGQVIIPLLILNYQDPLLGGHDPVEFSLDLPSLFIPGKLWRFSELTRFYWQYLKSEPVEMNNYPGWALIFLVGYAVASRKKLSELERGQILMWLGAIVFFVLMALGPRLQVWGRVTDIPMLYALMEKIVPFLTLTGVPVRMVMMAVLAGSVLASISIRELIRGLPSQGFLLGILLIVAVVETLPAPLITTTAKVPVYVQFLAEQPDDGGVLDLAAPTQFIRLYYGTVHEKPLVFGSTSRIPTSLYMDNKKMKDAIFEGDYRQLRDTFQIRYIATAEAIEVYDPYLDLRLIFDEEGVKVYRLEVR